MAFEIHIGTYDSNDEYIQQLTLDCDPVRLIGPSQLHTIYPKNVTTALRFVVRRPKNDTSLNSVEVIFGRDGRPGNTVYAHVELVNPKIRDRGIDIEKIINYEDEYECLAAGEVYFNNKHEIIRINNQSGGYRPGIDCLQIALSLMMRDGLKFSDDFIIQGVDEHGVIRKDQQANILNSFLEKARHFAVQLLIEKDEYKKLSLLLKSKSRRQDLDAAIIALDAYIDKIDVNLPQKPLIKAFLADIQRDKKNIPNRELPKTTELIYRILFHAMHPTHEANNKRATKVADNISKYTRYKYANIALAIFGALLVVSAIPILMVSLGGATPLSIALIACGWKTITAAGLIATIGVTGTAEIVAVGIGTAAVLAGTAERIYRAKTTSTGSSASASKLGFFSNPLPEIPSGAIVRNPAPSS